MHNISVPVLRTSWPSLRLKYICRLRYGDSLESSLRNNAGSVPVFGSNGMVGNHSNANTAGPTIIVGRKGSFGSVTYSECPSFCIDTAYYINDNFTHGGLRWLYYALQTLNLDSISQDTGVPGLSREAAYQSFVPCPSPATQKTIADFLDHETAEVDALVVSYERLIERLQEKSIALITQSVTKGLKRDVPTKESSIEWIGEMPRHWELNSLKQLFVFKKGKNAQRLTSEYCQAHVGPYPVYSGQTENNGIMGLIDTYDYDVPEVLFSTTVGARVMTPLTLRGKFSLSQNCLIGIPKRQETDTDFFFYALHPLFKFHRASIPDHMQPSLRVADIANFKIAVPPVDEQRQISADLKIRSVELTSLIEGAQQAIRLVRERRTALITAAVTGQIDVQRYRSSQPNEVRV